MSYKHSTNNIKIKGHVFRYINAGRIYDETTWKKGIIPRAQIGWRYFYRCKKCKMSFIKFRGTITLGLSNVPEMYSIFTDRVKDSCNDVKMRNLLL